MKSLIHPNSTGPRITLACPLRILAALATPLLALSLSGCTSLFISRHSVPKTIVIENVQTATVDQLIQQLSTSYNQIQSLNASVDIAATTGGEHKGEVKELPSFAGFIIFRKPADLHLLMLLPVVRSRALEMVADGKEFKLLIPPQNKAFTGSEEVKNPSPNGLYNLRPNVIRDAILIPPVGPGEYVYPTESARVTPPVPGRKESLEEPDYDLHVLRITEDHKLELVRVIHFGRATLKPYEQDIYDQSGRIVQTITYDKWQKYGDIAFPTSIFIKRPLDEYTLKIDVNKLTLNQQLDDEQFILEIPKNYTVQKM